MITNKQLREAFLTPQMKFYFDRKLAPLPGSEVDARVEEMLKYLNMAIHCSGDIPVSKDIDEVWHLWILQTAEYNTLCSRLHGGVFLHHTSNDYAAYADPDVKTRRIDLTLGVAILGSYVMNYGPFEADRLQYWPLSGPLLERFGGSLRQFNAWLALAAQPAALELAS